MQPDLFNQPQVYFNTTGLTDQPLQDKTETAGKQTDQVKELFRKHGFMTASRCHVEMKKHYGSEILLTSVRRAISVLKKAGVLEKRHTVPGPNGGPEHVYKYNQ
jgi:Fe2+ or Zn2+ uptake regulation protein